MVKEAGGQKSEEKLALLLEDLSALEEYVNDLFVFAPIPICFISPIGVILESNPALEKLSQFSSHALIGEPLDRLFGKEEVGNLMKELTAKGFFVGREMMLFTKSGEAIQVQVFANARVDKESKVLGYFLGLFDLTPIQKGAIELKEAQDALINILEDTEDARQMAEEEKNKTQTIIANLIDGILLFDTDNKMILINPQARVFFNAISENLIGLDPGGLARLVNFQPLSEILTPKTIQEGIFRKEISLKQGFVLEVSTTPWLRIGQKAGTLVVLHDITREKRIEKMKTEFVSLSAHQLRTPLSAIKWSIKILLDEDIGKLNEKQKDLLGKTYEANERSIILINDLLNVARIEEGRYLYSPEPYQLEGMAQAILDRYANRMKVKKLILNFKKPKEKLSKVMIDVEKIELVIENLLDNAMKYTPVNGEITVSLQKIGREIEFFVRDSGVGVPEGQQERIFTKFFRASNVLKLETEGTGLGLFLVKNIIEAHGGRIWFESQEGKGSTFYFAIPVIAGE